ncbi:MAG: MOSC domain-containing protein [Anaerolineae bacterium]|nr:MOSC domain-containing protein [Anaerolineae bacterium]
MNVTGKLEAIWIKRMKMGPMDPVDQAALKANRGLINNANQGGKRQVTIIEKEVWEKLMALLGTDLEPSARRANLMVSGINLADSRHKVLQIGTCRIRIYGETKPCEQMDAAFVGLQEAMRDNWAGGAFGEVLDDGLIAVGDPVAWIEAEG